MSHLFYIGLLVNIVFLTALEILTYIKKINKVIHNVVVLIYICCIYLLVYIFIPIYLENFYVHVIFLLSIFITILQLLYNLLKKINLKKT